MKYIVLTITMLAAGLWLFAPDDTPQIENRQSAPSAAPQTEISLTTAPPRENLQSDVAPISAKKLPTSQEALQVIESYNKRYFLNAQDREHLKSALLSPSVLQNIELTLTDRRQLVKENTEAHLKALNTLYDGLKNDDPEIQSAYRKIATSVLSDFPEEGLNREQRKLFVADRVELAFMTNVVSAELAQDLKAEVLRINSKSELYFERAQMLDGVYEASL